MAGCELNLQRTGKSLEGGGGGGQGDLPGGTEPGRQHSDPKLLDTLQCGTVGTWGPPW